MNYPGINGIVITSRDITDRILSIEALKDSERQFRAFLNSTDDMAFLKDSEERYIFVNYALSEFFGRNEEEILGKTDYSLMSKELADICHNTDLRALNSDDVVISEEEDSGFIFETRKFKLLLKNNKIGIGGLIRNITEKRKLEKQIIQSEKMSVVGQLAGGIAHDLNNILTALIGNTELLEKKLCDNCRKDSFRYIDALLKANSKAKNIILQILAFSKGQPIEKEIVDINDIVNDMGKMLSRLIPENIKIVKKVEEIKLFINADISQVEQIIMNLVINSRDAIPGQGTIEIITREQKVLYDTITKNGIIKPGEYAQLSIKDSGSGIAPAIIDKIFDPFFTTKEIGKGTGLGLSVVINNVNKNSGYINVYSEVGKGTEIKIYFKIVSEEEKLLTAIKQEELLFGNREKILIVEDDEGIRFMLTEYLRDLNYDITFAGNGIEAMEILNRFQIDAIITDLTMPDMGGLDLYRNVKNKMPNLPIIAMTGYYDYKELAGFDFHEVLDKPLDMTRVSIILKRLFKDKLK